VIRYITFIQIQRPEIPSDSQSRYEFYRYFQPNTLWMLHQRARSI